MNTSPIHINMGVLDNLPTNPYMNSMNMHGVNSATYNPNGSINANLGTGDNSAHVASVHNGAVNFDRSGSAGTVHLPQGVMANIKAHGGSFTFGADGTPSFNIP